MKRERPRPRGEKLDFEDFLSEHKNITREVEMALLKNTFYWIREAGVDYYDGYFDEFSQEELFSTVLSPIEQDVLTSGKVRAFPDLIKEILDNECLLEVMICNLNQ